jgi:hypothetical protein
LIVPVFWAVKHCRSVNSSDVSNGRSAFMFRVKQSKKTDCLTLKIVITFLRGVMQVPRLPSDNPERTRELESSSINLIHHRNLEHTHSIQTHCYRQRVNDSTLAAMGMLRRVKR